MHAESPAETRELPSLLVLGAERLSNSHGCCTLAIVSFFYLRSQPQCDCCSRYVKFHSKLPILLADNAAAVLRCDTIS